MKLTSFKDCEIWKIAIDLGVYIYKITTTQKFNQDYSLIDQIRRAVVSVSSNIAEGFEKNNNKELVRYLYISKGSIGELRSQIELSLKL